MHFASYPANQDFFLDSTRQRPKTSKNLNCLELLAFDGGLEEALDEGFVLGVEGVVAHVQHLVVGHLAEHRYTDSSVVVSRL